jgi:site-specific DNA-methyltransferase (adenine-specific)
MPDKLASDLIRCFCPMGGTVMDCFAGSGTTLVAAAKCERGYVGVEISPEFVGIINKRLDSEYQPDIFGKAG